MIPSSFFRIFRWKHNFNENPANMLKNILIPFRNWKKNSNTFFVLFEYYFKNYTYFSRFSVKNEIFDDISKFLHGIVHFMIDLPAGNYTFKVNNRNNRRRCEICSKLMMMMMMMMMMKNCFCGMVDRRKAFSLKMILH